MDEGFTSVEELSKNLSFRRWVYGSASEIEKKEWDNWIRKEMGNRKLAREAQQKILGITFNCSKELSPLHGWTSLEKRINQKFTTGKFAKRKGYRNRNWLLRIAAVVLLVTTTAVFSYLSFSRESNEVEESREPEWSLIETTYGEQKTITFSDGSSINLNSNATLRYTSKWVKSEATEVYLRGEAYFSISKREDPDGSAFRVITPDGIVEVMGTKFVVNAAEDATWVVLEEGMVSISKKGKESAVNSDGPKMKPNQLARFSRNSDSIKIEEVPNTKVFTSWKDQLLVLDSSPFSFMVNRIEHTYGVNVVVHDAELYKRKLTGTIKLKKLDYLIQAISDVMEIPVEYTGGTVYFGKKDLADKTNNP